MAMTKPVVDYLMGWAGRRRKAIDLANNAGGTEFIDIGHPKHLPGSSRHHPALTDHTVVVD